MVPQAVVLDFDFTLADSSRGVIDCVNYALKRTGLPPVSPDVVCQTIGLSLPAMLEYITARPDPSLVTEFVQHFAKRADEVMADLTQIYPGVPGVLSALSRAGMLLGIVSNKFRYRIEGIASRDGIRELFSVIIGSDDAVRHKPDPGGIEAAIRTMRCAPDSTVYVGDHVVDAEAARRAGVPFVGVLTGVTLAEQFAQFPKLAIIDTLSELPEVLGVDKVDQQVG